MADTLKRTLSMHSHVDQQLLAYVQQTPGASLSSTVNAALVDFLEREALKSYHEWDAAASKDERAALDAFSTHDDSTWAAE